ncbi:MAG: hypothetical protein QHH06_12750 [Clostridiales bacterium]|jgi:hypothetical protein|nr:hypothetical protein [Eubacteriales bacterium]MDH7567317.1 hypothetical protein [Clostridiales bacterium]
MLFAKRYETFDEMNKIYNMHFEAKETKMYLRIRMTMLSWDGLFLAFQFLIGSLQARQGRINQGFYKS